MNGRLFRFGSREVIVGKFHCAAVSGCRLGERIKFGGDQWEIVGVFDTEGSGLIRRSGGTWTSSVQAFERPVFPP